VAFEDSAVHVRVCRDCGEEYRPEIAVCADCGGTLEDRHQDESGPGLVPLPEPPLPKGADLVGYRPVFVTGHAPALVPLAERLKEAGIGFRLHESAKDPRAPAASFSLLVRDEDGGHALRALAPLLDESEEPDRLHAVELDFEGGAYRRCPACRAELPAAAFECPECGLALGAAGAACPRCGAPLGPGQAECLSCGAAGG
jgi:hypothetical protein